MRISNAPLLALAVLLAACSGAEQPAAAKAEGSTAAATEQAVEDDGKVACALAGAKTFARDCTIERIQQDGKLTLVVRHPDGGFRRFEVLTDGRGVAAVDGADDVESALVGTDLEVVVGADAYRFPATRKPVTQANAPDAPAAK
jgi:hypothetical protein